MLSLCFVISKQYFHVSNYFSNFKVYSHLLNTISLALLLLYSPASLLLVVRKHRRIEHLIFHASHTSDRLSACLVTTKPRAPNHATTVETWYSQTNTQTPISLGHFKEVLLVDADQNASGRRTQLDRPTTNHVVASFVLDVCYCMLLDVYCCMLCSMYMWMFGEGEANSINEQQISVQQYWNISHESSIELSNLFPQVVSTNLHNEWL